MCLQSFTPNHLCMFLRSKFIVLISHNQEFSYLICLLYIYIYIQLQLKILTSFMSLHLRYLCLRDQCCLKSQLLVPPSPFSSFISITTILTNSLCQLHSYQGVAQFHYFKGYDPLLSFVPPYICPLIRSQCFMLCISFLPFLRDEGIVLKDHSSKWEPSDCSGKWLKLKPEYIQAGSDLDVLIIGI